MGVILVNVQSILDSQIDEFNIIEEALNYVELDVLCPSITYFTIFTNHGHMDHFGKQWNGGEIMLLYFNFE